MHHSFPLAILSTDDLYLPWFFSNYIQLFCPRNFPPGQLNFYIHKGYPVSICPILDIQWFDRDIFDGTYTRVSEFLKMCLDKEWYVQLYEPLSIPPP